MTKVTPIPFSEEMVRALLDGRKTQTRLVIQPQPVWAPSDEDAPAWWSWEAGYNGTNEKHPLFGLHGIAFTDAGLARDISEFWPCPYGRPGDLLWVREAWAQRLDLDHLNGTQLYEHGIRTAWYWADGPGKCCRTGCAGAAGRYRHARFMPRWASRLTLELTDVRVQRVQEISRSDCYAEGIERPKPLYLGSEKTAADNARNDFRRFWDSINAKPGLSGADNPWVWALTFKVHHQNVDGFLKERAA